MDIFRRNWRDITSGGASGHSKLAILVQSSTAADTRNFDFRDPAENGLSMDIHIE